MKTRILAVVVCMCMVCSISGIHAIAATPPQDDPIGIQPFWVSTQTVSLNMSCSGGNANWSGKIQGFSGTTKITATFTLEKKNANGTYTFLKSWTASSSNDLLITSGSYGVSSGSTYRISVTATVTPKTGTPETVSDSLEKVL